MSSHDITADISLAECSLCVSLSGDFICMCYQCDYLGQRTSFLSSHYKTIIQRVPC